MRNQTLLFDKINSLPEHLKAEVLNFIDFISLKNIVFSKKKHQRIKSSQKKINRSIFHTTNLRNPKGIYSREELYNDNDLRGA